MTLATGFRLGPYEILSPLGAGGMGEVYRARDTRLGRDVAVKVLPEALADDPERLARFEQESRAIAALSHPNILAIHDVGREGSVSYAVLELLHGETVRGRLARGPLPWRDAVEVAAAMAEGLAAAHARGVVHRDLKPENLFLTSDGRLKILDFGLARRVPGSSPADQTSAPTEAGLTEPGMVLGTPAYLSPEQARGEAVDGRSDIFAFGSVFHEMLAGRPAFRGGSTAETLVSILRDEPSDLGGAAPPEVQDVVRRCLRKSPSERFQSASDLAFSLRAVLHEPGAPAATPAAGRRSIAVLPFKNLAGSAGDEHLGVALADAAITELALVQSLLVRPTAAILRFQGRAVEPEEAGRELGVDAVVDGSFQSAGQRLRVTVQLVETAGARPLWGTKIDASLEDVFALQDEVSRKIVEALRLRLTPSDERRLAAAAVPAPAAYELYLKGRFYLFSDTRRPAINAAIECFEKALALDANSALAMIGLADAWTRMAFSFDPEGGWYERAEALTERALALAPGLPEGHNLRARMLWSPRRRFDHAGAMRELCAAIDGSPSLGEAHHWLGMVLNHVGLLEQSRASFERALAISPDEYAGLHLGMVQLLQGRYEEGRQVTQAALSGATSSWSYYQLGHCLLRLDRVGEAAKIGDRASSEFPGDVLVLALLGLLAARAGDAGRARDLAGEVAQGRRSLGHYHHAQYDVGCIHALLGETREAVALLRDSAINGFPCLPFFESDPLLENVRGDSDYRRLIADLRAENDGYRRLYESLRPAREDTGEPGARTPSASARE